MMKMEFKENNFFDRLGKNSVTCTYILPQTLITSFFFLLINTFSLKEIKLNLYKVKII